MVLNTPSSELLEEVINHIQAPLIKVSTGQLIEVVDGIAEVALLVQPPDDTLCLEIVVGFLVWSMAGISTSKDEIDTFLGESFHKY